MTRPKTKAIRVELVARMLARAWSIRKINAYAKKKEWGVGFWAVRGYIKLAKRRAEEFAAETFDHHQARILARLEDMFRKARKEGKEDRAVKITDRICKLLGLFQQNLKVEHSGAVSHEHKHAHALFAQIDAYTEEFKAAALAEANENRQSAITASDRLAVGLPKIREEKWEPEKPVVLSDGTEVVPCEDDELIDADPGEEDAPHPLRARPPWEGWGKDE